MMTKCKTCTYTEARKIQIKSFWKYKTVRTQAHWVSKVDPPFGSKIRAKRTLSFGQNKQKLKPAITLITIKTIKHI